MLNKLTALQTAMLSAKAAVRANNTDPDTTIDPFSDLLGRWANSASDIDVMGDVWDHGRAKWWSDEDKQQFLSWLDTQD